MPILARIPPEKVIDAALALISYFRSLKNLVIHDMQINGYFLYRYRGILLVRKGISDVLLLNDFDAVKKYLVYVMRSVLRSDLITWAKTAGLVEIIMNVNREKKYGFIVLEVSNEEQISRGNLRIRVILRDHKDKQSNKNILKENGGTSTDSLINEIDELVYQEDLRDIAPLDIYEFFKPKEIEEILSLIAKFGGVSVLIDYEETRE
ncbi:MAG: hypothetical protein ACTSX9_00365 [Candidatus Njordarchaeales archaeon]